RLVPIYHMVSYNPHEWLRPLFYFHKSDTFRKLLPLLIGVGIYTGFVAWLEIKYIKLSDLSYVKNTTMMHNLLGFAISMLLVFRTNTAYDRWWEGRKLWGALVNNSRNFAIKIETMLPADMQVHKAYFSKLLIMFAKELSHHLRKEKTRLSLDTEPHPEIPDLDRSRHIPGQVVILIQRRLQDLYRTQLITGDQLIVLNEETRSLMDICGACERIKNTPIPYSYSTFIKKFIAVYVLTLPFGYVFSLGYIAIPVVMFIFYVLASLEIIAEEIEDPFGGDTNDLPMEKIADNIRKNVLDIFGLAKA
ncbi:MAG TPA: bestrophin family ion channel, partial [Phnomibacter sp.]|nr:bestrophin family ion channel [Phnomibacter sp.]